MVSLKKKNNTFLSIFVCVSLTKVLSDFSMWQLRQNQTMLVYGALINLSLMNLRTIMWLYCEMGWTARKKQGEQTIDQMLWHVLSVHCDISLYHDPLKHKSKKVLLAAYIFCRCYRRQNACVSSSNSAVIPNNTHKSPSKNNKKGMYSSSYIVWALVFGIWLGSPLAVAKAATLSGVHAKDET